ncbi:MAG: hypothetical protein A07HN63_01776 [uncultured archaeon A07HN63]|nr:MAG: hypothetical protein A07HN63_01776 [uncultured archaeon A07HN63]
MTVDAAPPEPPTLEAMDPNEYEDAEVVGDTDYRRDEIETLLGEGAWADAFETWAADTDLDDEGFAIATDMRMLREFDFFWDGFADRVGYHAPGIPEDWKQRDLHPDLDSWATVSGINAGLTELGQEVCEVLYDEYIDWESDYEAPDDLPDFDE